MGKSEELGGDGRLTVREIGEWLAPSPHSTTWSRYYRLLAYCWWHGDRITALAAVLAISSVGLVILAMLMGLGGVVTMDHAIGVTWLGLGMMLLDVPVVAFLALLGISRNPFVPPASFKAPPGQTAPPDLFVDADARGLLIGAVRRRRVEWWRIERVSTLGSEWTIRWAGGEVVILADEPRNAGLRRALRRVMRARAHGRLLPGEPVTHSVPSTALSPAAGAAGNGSRALARVSDDGGRDDASQSATH